MFGPACVSCCRIEHCILEPVFFGIFSELPVVATAYGSAPILPPSGTDWQCIWTANPDLLRFEDRLLLYYRGNGVVEGRAGRHDRIGVSEILEFGPGTLELNPLNGGEFIVDVGNEGSFDCKDVLDPATVIFTEKVWLYYSAIGAGADSVGLAVSDDGVNFEKVGKVLTGRAPEVVLKDGRIFMTYQKMDTASSYQVYLASSVDGLHFTDVQAEPIFPGPTGRGTQLSFATVRISSDGDTFYALYAGSAYLADEPDYFGLARSTDLISTGSSIPAIQFFGCGPKGAPDGGAIWFPALYETESAFVMLYEGSRGKYTWDLSSAICMASLDKL